MTKEIEIKMSEPAPCPACKRHKTEGYLLAFLRPRFKDEMIYNPKPTEFSHYEVFYRCSNPACNYTLEM